MKRTTWQSAVELIRQLGTRKGRGHFGRYSLEGTRHIERALRANLPLDPVIISQRYLEKAGEREAALIDLLHPLVVPTPAFAELTHGRKLGDIFASTPLPPQAPIAELLSRSRKTRLLVAVEVVEPGNVGAMIRTAHGLSVDAVVAVGASDPFNPKAVRTSMGSLFKMPIHTVKTAAEALALLNRHGIETVASVAENGVPLPDFAFPQRAAILMGSEFWGLSAETIQNTHHHVTIPMKPGIDSFSVSAATAILLYAAGLTRYN